MNRDQNRFKMIIHTKLRIYNYKWKMLSVEKDKVEKNQ